VVLVIEWTDQAPYFLGGLLTGVAGTISSLVWTYQRDIETMKARVRRAVQQTVVAEQRSFVAGQRHRNCQQLLARLYADRCRAERFAEDATVNCQWQLDRNSVMRAALYQSRRDLDHAKRIAGHLRKQNEALHEERAFAPTGDPS